MEAAFHLGHLGNQEPRPGERIRGGLVAGHEDHGGLVAQGLVVERLARLLVDGVEQVPDDGRVSLAAPGPVIGDDGVQDAVDAGCRAFQARSVEARQPVRQTQERERIRLADQTLVVAESLDDLPRMLAAELPAEDGPADDLGRELGHLGERVDLAPGGQSGPPVASLQNGVDHHGREFAKPRHVDHGPDELAATPPGLGRTEMPTIASRDEVTIESIWAWLVGSFVAICGPSGCRGRRPRSRRSIT